MRGEHGERVHGEEIGRRPYRDVSGGGGCGGGGGGGEGGARSGESKPEAG